MKKRCSNCFYRDRRFNEYPCLHCIFDGNHANWADIKQQMIIEELEKIKEKINSEDVNCQYEDDYVYSSGLQKAIEVIDNRIEELKGE